MTVYRLGQRLALIANIAAFALCEPAAAAEPPDDRQAVAAMDIAYQAAVKANDAAAMDAILHERFILVLGDGKVQSREALLHSARTRHVTFIRQDEDPGTQSVRLFGDTAIVTARLWLKGSSDGKDFDFRLWFSDTYVRTPQGWRYAFGQAGAPLP